MSKIKHEVGDRVAVFSRTEGRWFDDGIVSEALPSGNLKVKYNHSEKGVNIKEIKDYSKLVRKEDYYNEAEMLLYVRHELSKHIEESFTHNEFRERLFEILLEYKERVKGIGWKVEDIVDRWLAKLYKDVRGPVTFKNFKAIFPYNLNFTAFAQFISNFIGPSEVKQLCKESGLVNDSISESGILEFVHRLICQFESRIGRFVYFPKQSETHYWVQLVGGRLWRELKEDGILPVDKLAIHLQEIIRNSYLDLRNSGPAAFGLDALERSLNMGAEQGQFNTLKKIENFEISSVAPAWFKSFDKTTQNEILRLATQGLKHYGLWTEELDKDIQGMFFLSETQISQLRKFMQDNPPRPQPQIIRPTKPSQKRKWKGPLPPSVPSTPKKQKKNSINLDNTYWKISGGKVVHCSKISAGIYEVTLAQKYLPWAKLIFEGDNVNLIESTQTFKGAMVSSRRIRWESGNEWELTPSFFIGIWEQDTTNAGLEIRYEIRANLEGEDMFEVYDIFGFAWASCMLLRTGQVQLTMKSDLSQTKGRIKYTEVSSNRKIVDRIEWDDGDVWKKFYYRLNWKKFFLFLYRFAKNKEATRMFWYSNVGTIPAARGRLYEIMHLLIVHFETDQEARIVPNWYLTKNYCCEICRDILNDLDLQNQMTLEDFDRVITWCRNRGRPRPIRAASVVRSREASTDANSRVPHKTIVKTVETDPKHTNNIITPHEPIPQIQPKETKRSPTSQLRPRSLSSITITPSPPNPLPQTFTTSRIRTVSRPTNHHLPPMAMKIAEHMQIQRLRKEEDEVHSMVSIIELGQPDTQDWRSQWQAGSKIEIYLHNSWVESLVHKITNDDTGEWIHVIQEGKHMQLRRYDSTIRCRQKPNMSQGGIYRWPKHDKQVPVSKDDWKDGSLVEVYSRSKKKWLIGTIQAIFQSYLLDVSYYDPATHHSAFKQIQRDHPNIRPLKNQGSYRMCILCDIIVLESEWQDHVESEMHTKSISVIPQHFNYHSGKVYFSTVAFQEQNLMYFNQIKSCFQNKTASHIILSYLKTMVGTDVDVYYRKKWCSGVIVGEYYDKVQVLIFNYPFEPVEFSVHSKNIRTSGIYCPRLPFQPQFQSLDVLESTQKFMNSCWYSLCSLHVDENVYGRKIIFSWCAMGD